MPLVQTGPPAVVAVVETGPAGTVAVAETGAAGTVAVEQTGATRVEALEETGRVEALEETGRVAETGVLVRAWALTRSLGLRMDRILAPGAWARARRTRAIVRCTEAF